MSPDPTTLSAAEQARRVVLQMMAERGRGVVLVGAARLDLALEHLLQRQPGLSSDEQAFILLVTILVASIEACALLQSRFIPRATARFWSSQT